MVNFDKIRVKGSRNQELLNDVPHKSIVLGTLVLNNARLMGLGSKNKNLHYFGNQRTCWLYKLLMLGQVDDVQSAGWNVDLDLD